MVITVLCVIDTLGKGGGAEHLVASLAEPLRQNGIDVVFVDLFSWPDDLGADLERSGFSVHRLNLKKRWGVVRGSLPLRRIIKKVSPDIIWGHLHFGNMYASIGGSILSKTPSVLTFHSNGSPIPSKKTFRGQIARKLELELIKRSKHKIAVSCAVKETLTTKLGSSEIRVIYNGVNLDNVPKIVVELDRRRIRSELSVTDSDFLITVPARVVPEKGHSILINAISEIGLSHQLYPKVVAVGEQTNLTNSLKAECKRLNIADSQFRFLPTLPQRDLYRLIGSSDAVVLPSVREAFGLSAVEAISIGIPTILSRTGGLAEINPSCDVAYYFDPGDAKCLSEEIRRVMTCGTEDLSRRAYGRNLMQQHFSIDRCADEWAKLFHIIYNNRVGT